MVTYRFPPFNSIGAVRCGKMTKYLTELGHDVKVLTCDDQPLPATLKLEIPEEKVIYTKWWDINAPVQWLLARKKENQTGSLNTAGNTTTFKGLLLKFLGNFYKTLFHLPDGQIGWRKQAYKAGVSLLKEWKPDVIYASAWPISSMIVADKLGMSHNIPWVGELRDLWTDNPYSDSPEWKKQIERIWEKRLFNRASALTTISEHCAETLQKKYSGPIKVILNGFDPLDYEMKSDGEECLSPFLNEKVNILYAGMIYPGRRDPTPLLQAISMLSEKTREKIKVHFYGDQINVVKGLATKIGVSSNIKVNKPIPYSDILTLQKHADYLLLLMWDNPAEKGTFTGKFFEYVGSGRPILCIGGTNNPPAKLIIKRELGAVSNSPYKIAQLLEEMVNQKQQNGAIPSLPHNAGEGLTRKEQAEKLSDFLKEII
jgi:hypothetical protein